MSSAAADASATVGAVENDFMSCLTVNGVVVRARGRVDVMNVNAEELTVNVDFRPPELPTNTCTGRRTGRCTCNTGTRTGTCAPGTSTHWPDDGGNKFGFPRRNKSNGNGNGNPLPDRGNRDIGMKDLRKEKCATPFHIR